MLIYLVKSVIQSSLEHPETCNSDFSFPGAEFAIETPMELEGVLVCAILIWISTGYTTYPISKIQPNEAPHMKSMIKFGNCWK